MRLPARCEKCNHLSCFEAENYYWMNTKFKQWKCPICGIHSYNLTIDKLMMKISEKCNEIYPLAHDLSNLKRAEVIRILSKEILENLDDEDKDIDPNDKRDFIINSDLTITIGVRTFIYIEQDSVGSLVEFKINDAALLQQANQNIYDIAQMRLEIKMKSHEPETD